MNNSELNLDIYHEKQRRQLCLLHTLNNLFQREEFTQAELDGICESLDERRWLNAHRSWFGSGNYDANVLFAAISRRNMATVWFDSRLSARQIDFNAIEGFIFNKPSSTYVPFFKGRHWFAVRRLGAQFYNLDSKLSHAEPIADIIVFANSHLAEGNQILLVTNRDRESDCVRRMDTSAA